MKRLVFFIIIAVSVASTTLPIDFTSLVREGVEWGYRGVYHSGFSGANGYEPYNYGLYFEGDTIVDGQTYKKMYRHDTGAYASETQTLYCLMREDSANVYVRVPKLSDGDINTVSDQWYLYDLYGEFSDCYEVPLYFYSADRDSVAYTYNGAWEDYTEFRGKYSSQVLVGNSFARKYTNDCSKYEFIDAVGIISRGTGYGNMPFPLREVGTNNQSSTYLLYLRDRDSGDILYAAPDMADHG